MQDGTFQKKTSEMKEYSFNINGKEFNVTVNGQPGRGLEVTVNGKPYDVEVLSSPTSNSVRKAANTATRHSEASLMSCPSGPGQVAAKGSVTSPLPGVITQIFVREGQSVKRGDKLATLEAMKMENNILSGKDGTVRSISAGVGTSVLEGAVIMTID